MSNLKSGLDMAQLARFVVDMFCTSMIDVANEFGVPTMVFFIADAMFLGFMLHIHKIQEQENVDTMSFNFKESGTEFSISTFENLVPASVFTEAVLDKGWDSFFFSHANELRKVKGIIVNTFKDLEPHAVQSFRNSDFKEWMMQTIYSYEKRIRYHNGYLSSLLHSINEDGCNVKGYFVWSLLDNWEWAAGYTSRFGLYFVDYRDNLKRYPKQSVQWFKNFLNPQLLVVALEVSGSLQLTVF
ncbi:hypothetical protein K1719_004137 [Acacia pycnantha]|nr:hypothetical protein K1719_004137 [Acacia pycnantha]